MRNTELEEVLFGRDLQWALHSRSYLEDMWRRRGEGVQWMLLETFMLPLHGYNKLVLFLMVITEVRNHSQFCSHIDQHESS